MIKAFRKLGHEVKVVSLIGEQTNVATKKQGKWTRIKKMMPGFVFELAEIAYNLHGYRMLSYAIRDFKPDFIYDRYVNYNYSAVAAGNQHRVPVILEVNAPYSLEKLTFDENLTFKNLSRRFESKICRDASKVIAVSTPLKNVLVSSGVPADQIVVMPNGADPDVFRVDADDCEIRRQWGLEGKIVIGFTGILRPWHGLDLLIDAFESVAKRRKDLHLLIVGDGPIRDDIERTIAQKGLFEKVSITGRQPHEKVNQFVAAIDIAVSPRATFYASPMKLLEYMAMGKAIVAPDMENIRDILSHQEDGILFQAEDADAMAKAMEELVSHPARRIALGKQSRKKIEAERTWLHNARDVVSMVEAL